MQRHLYEHFQLPGHTGFLQDTYVTLTNKTDPRAPTKHEDYSIHSLKTKAPMGLNVEGGSLNDDPTYSFSTVFILRNITRFLPRVSYSRLRKDLLVLLYCLKFRVIRIIRRLSKKFYSIPLYDLFSLYADFMNSRKLHHYRFSQYFISFRFREFPSALRNIASFIDNQPIFLTKSRD